MTLGATYREKVSITEVPDDKLRDILAMVLDHLKLDIFREETPDYTHFELWSRATRT